MIPFENVIDAILSANHIIITAHKSPDGDSVGSSLGLHHFISKLGKSSVVCHPDPAPDYLFWLDRINKILNCTNNFKEVSEHFAKADLIFCLDYNAPDRVGEEMQIMMENSSAKKIMIDHHLNPKDFTTISISEPQVSSVSELIVQLIQQTGNIQLLDEKIGTPLYLGILTDTGTFRFSSVRPETHEAIAKLLSAGVRHAEIHEKLNDNNTESRLRLQGFAMSQKLEIMKDYGVAIISLTEAEHALYNFQKGDTDGIPNTALSIKGIKAAILLSEREGYIRISFRSKGSENPINILAAEHFEGGGHANASGGKSTLTMPEAIEKLKNLIPLFFNKI